MSLPQKLPWDKASTTWATQLDPVINSPTATPVLLPNVSLASGTNTINHRLGRKLVGWQISRIRASATVYDTQDSNPIPDLTLQLVASAAVVVDLLVW